MKRYCLNCGKTIGTLKSILFNNCCSYVCDCTYEEENELNKKRVEKPKFNYKDIKEKKVEKKTPAKKKNKKQKKENEDCNDFNNLTNFNNNNYTNEIDEINDFYDYYDE